jgi:3',5'-cyclic AMP phosphodiesterase CpdA
MTSLAHISDLHLDGTKATEHAFEQIVSALQGIDVVLATGDITNAGTKREYSQFEELSAPIREKLVVLPGNHDRCGDDIGRTLMGGARVDLISRKGCSVVRIDSTADHNNVSWVSHGRLCQRVLQQVDLALARVPRGNRCVVALHHHVMPLPAEGFWERVSELLRLPNHGSLALGPELLRVVRGRCDLVLHGHRHIPRQFVVDPEAPRPLHIFNGGSTTSLGAFRCFELTGRTLAEPQWKQAFNPPRPSPQIAFAPLCILDAEALSPVRL